MSSAILYLAIVAIWACVLIPRWLKRDTPRGAATTPGTAPPADAPLPLPLPADADAGEPDLAGFADDAATQPPLPTDPPAPLAQPLSAEETRRRMLTGRRRLLGMLIALETAAIALAAVRLAAMWVIVPPSIMLIGYLLLLREAAHADTERAQHNAEAVARAREPERAHARARATRHPTPAEGTPGEGTSGGGTAAAAAALAAKFAAAPVPADYEDSGPGRDFAPGLAGKYTTSNANHEFPPEDDNSYEAPRLRAVGD
jgi:hypothetical protein